MDERISSAEQNPVRARAKHESGAVAREEDLSPLRPDGTRRRILTGDRTTGKLHLGHWVGSLKNRVRLQELYDTFILMADVQALTTHYDRPEVLKESVREVALDYLAAGIDPEKATIVIQSLVPAIADLTVYYGLLVPVRSLIDNPTTKAEAEQHGFALKEQSESEVPSDLTNELLSLKHKLEQQFTELEVVSIENLYVALAALVGSSDNSIQSELSARVLQIGQPLLKEFENNLHQIDRAAALGFTALQELKALGSKEEIQGNAEVQAKFAELKTEALTNLAKAEALQARNKRIVAVVGASGDQTKEIPREVITAAEEQGIHVNRQRSDLNNEADLMRLVIEATDSSISLQREVRRNLISEKRQRGFTSVSYGFLGYPISQAADITFVDADLVPVGPDQVPLIELCREVVDRFNHQYGDGADILRKPQALLGSTDLIRGIDGSAKMSKSQGNAIYLSESDAEIWDKLRPAPTDPQRVRKTDPGRPEMCNIFAYHSVFNGGKEPAIDEAQLGAATVEEVAYNCSNAQWGCIDCKKNLALKLTALLDPMRARRAQWEAQPHKVREILLAGTERARAEGEKTLARVKSAMHMDYFS